MNVFYFAIGIAIVAVLILMGLEWRKRVEAFSTIAQAKQSSYLSSDIPGAVTPNPTVSKPTPKEVIDAQDVLRQFLDLTETIGTVQDPAQQQSLRNLQNRIPLFQNQLQVLLANPDAVNATQFYATVAEYKQAIQSLKQGSLEGFVTSTNPNALSVKNLLDAISVFEETYATKNIDSIKQTSDKQLVQDLHQTAERTSKNLQQSSIPSDSAFAQRLQLQTAKYQEGQSILNNLPTISSQPQSSESMTLKGVKDLLANIQAEQLRLQNLRSTESTILKRIRLLDLLLADLREIVRKVESGEMKLSEIPIKPSDAQAFLSQYKTSDPLPPLLKQTGSPVVSQEPSSTPSSVPETVPGPAGTPPAELIRYLSNLKWSFDIKVQNDPGIAYRERTMDRIEKLEQRLAAYAYNDTPIPPALQTAFLNELRALSRSISTEMDQGDPVPSTLLNADPQRQEEQTRMPPDARLEEGSPNPLRSSPSLFDSASNTNEDAMLRPGFLMTDDTIQRRGSASAFDDSLVGGLDYKQRAKDLCRQIQSAHLGEPANFGCIANQDAVGPTYSWKGNYEMVCNRIGDTWGGWYPEMFGCPKYDPTMKYKGTN